MNFFSKAFYFVFLLSFFQLFFSCSNDEKINNVISSIQISSGELYPQFNPEITDYYITSLNTLNEIEVTINDFNPAQTIYINLSLIHI